MARGRGPEVKVSILGDASGLEKALGKSSSGLGKLGTEIIGTFGGNLLTKGFDLAAGAVKGLADFALEGVGKLDAYGDSLAMLDARTKGLAGSVDALDLTRWGVDKGEAAAAAAAIAATAQALGVTGDELKVVTPNMTELAAKLASLGDGDPEKVATQLAAALKGSTKAAAALGVELPKGAKGMAAYEAIMAQLAPKVAEATSGQASLADVGERWDATLANLQLQLAGFLDSLAPVISALLDQLMPAFDALVQTVGPILQAAFAGLSAAVSDFAGNGGLATVAELVGTIADVAKRLATFFAERVLPAFMQIASAIAEALGPALAEVGKLWDAWMPVLEGVWSILEATLLPVLTKLLIPALGKLLEIVVKVATALGGALSGAMEKVGGWFRKLESWAQPVIRALQKVADLAGGAIGKVSGVLGIGGRSGGSSRSAPGGVSIVVNAGVGDPVAIGREVSRVLGAYSSRSGHLVTG
jgi:hypothetical protein